MTSNVQIQETEGGPLISVILRGAYTTPGGTAEILAQAIEVKCFGRGRDLLRRWIAMFKQLYPGEEWTGPEPTSGSPFSSTTFTYSSSTSTTSSSCSSLSFIPGHFTLKKNTSFTVRLVAWPDRW